MVYAVGWFLVTATLPRHTSDPGALLPGAVLVGGSLAGLQWFMQYYLPVKAPGAVARLRTRGEGLADQATTWVDERRGVVVPVDLAVDFYEHDDSFAVLGAAIALRLFLFFVPCVLVVTALLMLFVGHDGVKSLADNAGVTGGLATQIDQATTASKTTTFGLLVAGVWLTVWAGRSLTKVLAACSAGAWRLGGRRGRPHLRMAGAVTTMTFLLVLTAAFLNRVKDNQGIAVITTSWMLAIVIYAVGWFLVTATLPRGTSDPGALLPGAVASWAPRSPGCSGSCGTTCRASSSTSPPWPAASGPRSPPSATCS